jgi:protein-glutamine gamma-glutamyltransferase
MMLDFDAIPSKDTEFKLSRLCRMVLSADRKKTPYGLKLPDRLLSAGPGSGTQASVSQGPGPVWKKGFFVLKPSAGHVVPVICALAVAMAPHALGLPLWIIAWCVFMWLYMLVQLKTGWPVPGPVLRHVLAFAGITGLLATFRVQIGADAFVGLMAVMAAIKPFEMATHRHRMITVLLTYFIIITSLFRSESLWTVLYMFVSVFVTTLALVRINHPQGRLRPGITLTARIMAQAIPLMILLFLLFPRLQQGLFSMETPGPANPGLQKF